MPISGRRYPACRLALSPAAAIDLINRMQQVATALYAIRRRQAGRRGRAGRRNKLHQRELAADLRSAANC